MESYMYGGAVWKTLLTALHGRGSTPSSFSAHGCYGNTRMTAFAMGRPRTCPLHSLWRVGNSMVGHGWCKGFILANRPRGGLWCIITLVGRGRVACNC
ncbi:hypothetical protein PR202_gb29412 [Eleusine coracana subsp. coracana]|uniref:Uncharacterized protein n=1 Tax=Eleusine coracana subsp. coracana TaxID=191504 RepID=A0AAV5FX05_ELECO|nr:hypothetical protein PR202_gb29412 [Eleusine coracana subsp. coracana]